MRRSRDALERGSAAVEFIFLGVLLVIPLVYFVVTLAQVQAHSFATANAATHAAKVYTQEHDPAVGRAKAEAAIDAALEDFGLDPASAKREFQCSLHCGAPGSLVTVSVSLDVPLPLFSRYISQTMKVVHIHERSSAQFPRFY